jgi:hypothetical protein
MIGLARSDTMVNKYQWQTSGFVLAVVIADNAKRCKTSRAYSTRARNSPADDLGDNTPNRRSLRPYTAAMFSESDRTGDGAGVGLGACARATTGRKNTPRRITSQTYRFIVMKTSTSFDSARQVLFEW